MSKALSVDLRERVVRAYPSGEHRLPLISPMLDAGRHDGRRETSVLCGWLPHCKAIRMLAAVGYRPVFGLRLR